MFTRGNRWHIFGIGRDASMLKHAIDVGKAQGADDGLINEAQHASRSQGGVELLRCDLLRLSRVVMFNVASLCPLWTSHGCEWILMDLDGLGIQSDPPEI